MKLGPVTKFDKRNKKNVKKIDDDVSCQKIVTSLSFFGFMASLKLSGSWILDAQYVKLIFSLIGSFYLTKTKNRTK